jgi:hypothetical protein
MRTITAETTAYLTTQADARELTAAGNDAAAIEILSFHRIDMTSVGWIRVGKATISVEIPDDDQLVASAVTTLRAEIQKTRADAEIRCQGLNKQIEQLLAIEYTPA